ncbi:cupin domain-containing protein [Leucobacter sp. M11]|uniref:cupin domain-containing protein n=1 Tax=Leucobacter sp. M11 TaxID=2993565 RepID=UPI002D7ED3A6|nr:cupin domain-containing protein [Leucobacter sp. M11]MEB4615330.1 cupin domain-containing protein [Leucobacter sp. M11]
MTDRTLADSSAVALHGAATAELGPFAPKATAITPGVADATRPIWSGGAVQTGIWECEPGSFTGFRDGYAEICVFLSGRVTVQGEGDEPIEFGPGDVLVMPSGWRGVWHVHERLRKHYTSITD